MENMDKAIELRPICVVCGKRHDIEISYVMSGGVGPFCSRTCGRALAALQAPLKEEIKAKDEELAALQAKLRHYEETACTFEVSVDTAAESQRDRAIVLLGEMSVKLAEAERELRQLRTKTLVLEEQTDMDLFRRAERAEAFVSWAMYAGPWNGDALPADVVGAKARELGLVEEFGLSPDVSERLTFPIRVKEEALDA